jgi:RNA polymerase sigma factor (sigma-70 family)
MIHHRSQKSRGGINGRMSGSYFTKADVELVALHYGGDDLAFEVLHAKHEPELRRVAAASKLPLERQEEAVQTTLAKLFSGRRAGNGRFVPTGSFKSWLCRVCSNACNDQWREIRKTDQFPDNFDVESGALRVDASVENTEELAALADCAAQLEGRDVLLYQDVLIKQTPHQQIATLFGTTQGAIAKAVSRLRAQLAACLCSKGFKVREEQR